MQIVPALDVRGGEVVRLGEHGDFDRQRAYGDPLELARRYAAAGARRIHVVDLDGARGTGENGPVIERLVANAGIEVEVAGGVRTAAGLERWLRAGVAAVAMGTAAVREPVLLAAAAARHPGRVMAALDVRGGRPAVQGWASVEAVTVAGVLRSWASAPLGGVILTSVDRDGTLAGPDLDLLAEVLAATTHPVTYSGGVRSIADLRALAAAGAAGVILGRSLLEGLLSLPEALAFS
jgi:phosphoribosylformimino-5-aminoimidazole carboxamide ribotide isomerase